MRNNEFDDPAFLARLRDGDHAAFRALIRRFHNSLIRVAAAIIGSRAQAEEVVQDAWLAVFSGIGRFEGRSSLITWLFSIVLNRARTRARREGRLVGLPATLDGGPSEPGGGRAVPIAEFQSDGHWNEVPRWWDELDPERIIAGRQLWDHVQDVMEHLPAGQRAVIILRDVESRSAEEACTLLSITAENQRVLLHRARGQVRRAIDRLLATEGDGVHSSAGTTAARLPRARSSAVAPVVRLLALLRAWMPSGRPGAGLCQLLATPDGNFTGETGII